MASLKKRAGTAIWQAQFYIKDPSTGELRQVRKSTGQSNRKKAMAVAIDLERNAQGVMAAGSDRAQQAKAILAEACAEIDRETFTEVSARKYLSKLVRLVTGQELQSFTVKTWTEEWLRRKGRPPTKKSTMDRYKSHTKSFLDWLGKERANKPLETITTQDARLWVESIMDTGVVGKTAQSYSKDMGGVYRSALKEGIIAVNPFSALDPIDTSDSQERKPFLTAEVIKLMEAAPTWEWRGLILVGAFTGLRLGNAAQLRWDTINMPAKLISLVPSKRRTKKRIHIPIQADLYQFLEKAPSYGADHGEFVFPSLSGLAVNHRDGLSLEFVRIMGLADVSRGEPSRVLAEGETKGKGRITFERGFHSFRHTFTSWLRKAGVSAEDRMALTGHTTLESHMIYSHEDEEALRKAIAGLPSIGEAA